MNFVMWSSGDHHAQEEGISQIWLQAREGNKFFKEFCYILLMHPRKLATLAHFFPTKIHGMSSLWFLFFYRKTKKMLLRTRLFREWQPSTGWEPSVGLKISKAPCLRFLVLTCWWNSKQLGNFVWEGDEARHLSHKVVPLSIEVEILLRVWCPPPPHTLNEFYQFFTKKEKSQFISQEKGRPLGPSLFHGGPLSCLRA
jgi:hypothetical protein